MKNSTEHQPQIHIHILHEADKAEKIRQALDTPEMDYLVLTYASESSAINRKTGARTAHQLAW